MASKQFEYRGHEIEIRGGDQQPDLRIDAEKFPAERIAENIFATLALPHANFSTLESLAKAVIDHAPAYHGRRDA